ncbi:MAG: M23 family metallopeptidase [Treponema sp.]|nr:M23 family metallopeptidase [Treponema sp.]
MKISKMLKSVNIAFILFSLCCFSLSADSSYIVKKGDTLYSISRKYQITVPELRAANNLSENDVLKVGVKLVIPSADIENAAALSASKTSETKPNVSSKSATSYIVQKGDTLYGIARKYNIKLNELLSLNNLDNSSTIKIGQKILVPAGSSSSASTVASGTGTNSTKTQVPAKTEKNPSSAGSSGTKTNSASTAVSSQGVSWPLSNPVVKNISGKVSGVQLTGKDNESVVAVREGTVMYTGVYRGFGEVIFVQSKTGLIYSYSGLNKVSVKKGDYVVFGAEIGKTGRGNDSSIKFMVFQNGMPINPASAPRG